MCLFAVNSLKARSSVCEPEEETSSAATDPHTQRTKTSRYSKCANDATFLLFPLIIQSAVCGESLLTLCETVYLVHITRGKYKIDVWMQFATELG